MTAPQTKTTQTETTQTETTQTETIQTETTQTKPAQTKPAQTKPAKVKAEIRRIAIVCLYTPTAIALGHNSLQAQTPAARLLSLAMLLFCVELARMARVDLDNVALIQPQSTGSQAKDSLLKKFRLALHSTIVLELLGFYGTYISLQWGAVIVLFSQLWFNLLAGIQLWPQRTEAIEIFGLKQRLPVLAANATGLVLLSLWTFKSARLWLSAGLLALVLLFLLLKYVVPAIQAFSIQLSKTASKENN